jgi:hypothetical protein
VSETPSPEYRMNSQTDGRLGGETTRNSLIDGSSTMPFQTRQNDLVSLDVSEGTSERHPELDYNAIPTTAQCPCVVTRK